MRAKIELRRPYSLTNVQRMLVVVLSTTSCGCAYETQKFVESLVKEKNSIVNDLVCSTNNNACKTENMKNAVERN